MPRRVIPPSPASGRERSRGFRAVPTRRTSGRCRCPWGCPCWGWCPLSSPGSILLVPLASTRPRGRRQRQQRRARVRVERAMVALAPRPDLLPADRVTENCCGGSWPGSTPRPRQRTRCWHGWIIPGNSVRASTITGPTSPGGRYSMTSSSESSRTRIGACSPERSKPTARMLCCGTWRTDTAFPFRRRGRPCDGSRT